MLLARTDNATEKTAGRNAITRMIAGSTLCRAPRPRPSTRRAVNSASVRIARLEPSQSDSKIGHGVPNGVVGLFRAAEEDHAFLVGHFEPASREDGNQLVGAVVDLDNKAFRATT